MPLVKPLLKKTDELNPVSPKILDKFLLNIKILTFLLVIAAGLKIYYIISFPEVVLTIHQIAGIPASALIHFLFQCVMLCLYLVGIFVLSLQDKLKPKVTFIFSFKVF